MTSYPFSTPFGTFPFSKYIDSDFKIAIEAAIQKAKDEIQQIVDNPKTPTFVNTVQAMAFSGAELERISSTFFNIHSAETNDEIEQIAQEVSPLLAAFGNDLTLNPELFKRVKAVYDEQPELDIESHTLLNDTYKSFVRNGALLNDEKKEKLRKIDEELSLVKLNFGKNILADQNAYRLQIIEESDLAGLPEDVKEMAKELATTEGKEGWLFSLDFPSYVPFMKYAEKRDLRKEMAIAYGKRAYQNNEYNNEANVLKIAQLRYERAQLLGYANHAQFTLEERMAQSPEKVISFLNDLLSKAKPAAEREFLELKDFARQLDGIIDFQKWDASYYTEKLRRERFSLDDETLKPYFQLENVLQGAFTVANRLYDLHFEEIHTIDKYHEEVKTYQVTGKDNALVAIFYADFFPRKGKRNGAWMTSFKPQFKTATGENERPHVSIVTNFSRPTNSKPSLLTFNEVTTLFHEFGHSLHGMLANTKYPNLSGTSVFWDFVELPSQVMENWCYEKEVLELFAHHYETGEIIPMELIEKIKESASFMEGMATIRQISFGLLDMAWHGGNPSKIIDLKVFENEQFASTRLYPEVEENAMSPSFSHIFNGGYSAGYYSYKWAEVLDADAFAYFKENGIFSKEIASKFKDNVLSKGGTEHPMVLYKRFRGQEPTVDALLRRAGLIR